MMAMKKMKIVIVGANHAGLAAVRQLVQNGNGDFEITVIDRENSLGYISGATPLLIRGAVSTYKDFFSIDIKEYLDGIDHFYAHSTVTRVDFDQRRVFVESESKERKHSFVVDYDKLVLATGSFQQKLQVKNSELSGIYTIKNLREGLLVNQKIDSDRIKNVAIVGGGSIGVELSEAISKRRKKVTLFEIDKHLLGRNFSKEFSKIAERQLLGYGVELELDSEIIGFEGRAGKVSNVITTNGSFLADMVIITTGFLPNTNLGGFHLDKYTNGAYIVDAEQRTSDPDVYAVGDCATVSDSVLSDLTVDFSVANALQSGKIAAKSIMGVAKSIGEMVTTRVIRIFGLNFFATGITEKIADAYRIGYGYVDDEVYNLLPAINSGGEKVKLRIIYRNDDHRIIGAQICSKGDFSGIITFLSLAVQKKVTIDELEDYRFFFYPYFNTPDNILSNIAQKGIKELGDETAGNRNKY